MFCKKCGYELKGNEKFCKRCGQAVQSGAENFNIPPIPPNQQTPPPKKKKKTGRIVALVTALVLVAGACGGVFVFRDEILGLFSKTKTFDENNVGEIYCAAVDPEHIGKTENGCMYADNEVLLVATDGTSYKKIEKLAKDYDAEIVGWIEQTGDYQLKFSGTYSMDEIEGIVQELEAEKDVDSASVNYIVELSDTAATEERDGFYYGKKWQSDLQKPNDAKGKSWGIESIETFAAWDLLKQNSDKVNPIRIGLIDVGFDTSHEDLGFAEVFYEDGNNGASSSDKKHGTHVAGIMAASTEDNKGICGVYPYGDGKLYAVSYGVIDLSENGNYWTSVMVQKISYSELILRNVKVINQSEGFNWYESNSFKNFWGNTNYKEVKKFFDDESNFSSLNPAVNELGDFFERMLKRGYDFVIVSAAGNDSDSSIDHLNSKYASWNNMIDKSDFPDVYARIIVVGALNYKMNVASYSNGGERVDVYAPGGDGNKQIYSTVPNSKYGNMSGTSMAAPHVSGVAAMVWSANNSLTGAEVKDIVCSYSNGRCTSCKMVDAYVAVQKALGKEVKETESTTESGGVLCYVVNKEDENTKIENAKVTMVNVDTNEEYTATTDSSGHFELFLPEGKYTLTVTADGYEDYTWPGDNTNFQNPIEVKNNGVNYLDDWIKLTPKSALPDLVQAVLDNESTWTQPPEEYVNNLNNSEVYSWFQDLDMDGTPEFIVGPMVSGAHAAHDYYVWKEDNGSLAKFVFSGEDYWSESDSNLVTTWSNFDTSEFNRTDDFISLLYKDKSSGEYLYIFPEQDGVSSEIYQYLRCFNCTNKENITSVNSLFTITTKYDGSEVVAKSYSTSQSEEVSAQEFLDSYNSFFANLQPYNITIKDISYADYRSANAETKQSLLLDSYNAWNYQESAKAELPFADEVADIDASASTSTELSEDELKKKVEEASGGVIDQWLYYDYDGNGTKEAYVAIRGKECGMGDYNLAALYFIDSLGDIEIAWQPTDTNWCYYVDNEAPLMCGIHMILGISLTAHGSGWTTLLFSVKDGNMQELNLSGEVQGFYMDGDRYYTTYNDFSNGYHEYHERELIYDSENNEFILG